MAASTGISNIAALAELFGGNKTNQQTTANTNPLEQVVASLSQQQDPAAQLTSLFQSALGAMPQLQARYSNAVGARTGGNAAVQTALDKLLQDTVIKGQSQVASQDLARQTAAGQAAASLANATRNVTTQQGTNLGRAATGIGMLQGGAKLMETPMAKKAGDALMGMFGGGDAAAPAMTSEAAPLFQSSESLSQPSDYGFGMFSDVNSGAGLDLGSVFDFGGASDLGGAAVDANNSDAWDYVMEFADGGLVGRDGNQPTVAKAGGARRSAAPSYTRDAVQQSSARNSATPDLAALLQQQVQTLTTPQIGNRDATSGQGGNAVPEGTDLGPGLDGRDATKLMMSILGGPLAMGLTVGDIALQRNGVNTKDFGLRDAMTLISDASNPLARAAALLKGANALMAPPKQAQQSGGMSAGAGASSGSTAVQQGDQTYYQSRGESGFSGGDQGGFSAVTGGQNSSPTGFGGPSFSFTTPSASPGSSSSDSGSGYARGGEVQGPGTGTSDSIKARLSDGEYVIPADVVKQLGIAFFDGLKDRFHEPAYLENAEHSGSMREDD